MNRRFFSRSLIGAVIPGVIFSGCKAKEQSVEDSVVVARAREYADKHLLPQHRSAFIETAREVEKYYSTALIREAHGGHVFEWPANFMAPNAKKRFEKFSIPGGEGFEFPAGKPALGQWRFFWPTMSGYDLENWMNELDPRLIEYVIYQLHPSGSDTITTEQSMARLHASKVIEVEPGLRRNGLDGYRWILPDGTPRDLVEWVGKRQDGKLFRMSCIDPDHPQKAQVPYPQCSVAMFDADTGEEVVYRYPLKLFEHWQSIEEQTRKIIRSWRIR